MDKLSTTPMLTLNDLARRWNVHQRTIKRLIDEGELAALRIGWQWRISAAEVLRYEASTTVIAETEVIERLACKFCGGLAKRVGSTSMARCGQCDREFAIVFPLSEVGE